MTELKMPALNVDIAKVIKEAVHIGLGLVIDWNNGDIATSNRDKWSFEISLDSVKEGFSPKDGQMILTFFFSAKASESHCNQYRHWMQTDGDRIWSRYARIYLRKQVPDCYGMYVCLDYYNGEDLEA